MTPTQSRTEGQMMDDYPAWVCDDCRSGHAGLTGTKSVDTGAQIRRLNMAGVSAATSATSDHALLTAWQHAARDRLAIR